MKMSTVDSPRIKNDLLEEQIRAERKRRFQIVDRIKERLPDLTADEVAQDVAEAIAAVRSKQ
jgi:hypothetical protein